MIIPTYEEIKESNSKALQLENQTNDLLKTRNYNEIIRIFSDKGVHELAGKNQSIYILMIMFHLMEYEINNTGKTTLEGKNTTQIIRIYRLLSLYLRRIEFDFLMEEQREILEYINQERIGLEIVLGIISNNTSIIQKQKVADGFSRIIAG